MTLSKKQQVRLESIIRQAELILKEAIASDNRPVGSRKTKPKETKQAQAITGLRRSRAAAADFRKEILAARKKGACVAHALQAVVSRFRPTHRPPSEPLVL